MVPKLSPDITRRYPGEQIQYAADGAAEEAEWVAAFLTRAGFVPGEPHGFTAGLLLDLGGMVRLRAWEEAGLAVHRAAGLPTAREALGHIIDVICAAAADPAALARAGHLGRAVFELRMSRFAWAAPTELGADVALDGPDEDGLIESLADLLWATRLRQPAE